MDHLFSLSFALWGAAGAFIPSAPRLAACLNSCKETGARGFACTGDFLIALLIGAIGAAAFSPVAIQLSHLKDPAAIATMIGLLANRLAPNLIKGADSVLGAAVESPLAKLLRGSDKP